MLDGPFILTPISQREFDLYSLSLPDGPNFHPLEYVSAWKADRGTTVGAVLVNPEAGEHAILVMRRRVDHRFTAVADTGGFRSEADALSALAAAMPPDAPAPPLSPGELAEVPGESTLRLHPRLAEVYAGKVARLEEALNDPSIKAEATEILRSLIDRIELRPDKDGSGLNACLYGDLARILAFCEAAEDKKELPGSEEPGSQLSVVAGARKQRESLTLPVRLYVQIPGTQPP